MKGAMNRVCAGLVFPFASLAALAVLAVPSACGSSGGAPATSSPVLALSADAGDEAGLSAIASQCAAWPAHPLTAGSYTDPKTGLTMHWPSGWKLQTVGTNSNFATLATPVTFVPTGSTTALQDEATFTLSVSSYGNAGQVQQALQDPRREAITLAGHPGALGWWLAPPPQPQCPAGCLSIPPLPEILTITGLVPFTTIDAGVGFGVEVDLTGSARLDALPAQVFCDIEAMILGVTVGP
jgi:hypothetical protein